MIFQSNVLLCIEQLAKEGVAPNRIMEEETSAADPLFG